MPNYMHTENSKDSIATRRLWKIEEKNIEW